MSEAGEMHQISLFYQSESDSLGDLQYKPFPISLKNLKFWFMCWKVALI